MGAAWPSVQEGWGVQLAGRMVQVAKPQPITTQMPIVKLVRPFQEFAARETSGGILLLACTLVALVWANSPWVENYTALWHTPLTP